MKGFMNRVAMSLKDEHGGVIVLVALLLVVLMGITVLVIDVGELYLARRQMVNAADSAALAGVLGKNEQQARKAAEEYAEVNGAEGFNRNNDVRFKDIRISVKVSREVKYNFAQVLGFGDSTIVSAVATAAKGPGNPIVPFVDVAWHFECPCDPECTCEVNCTCDPCECDPESECSCDPCECEADCPCDPECTCSYFEYDGNKYYMKNEAGLPIKYGDYFELHYDRWQNWDGYTSGTFPYIRLGDQTGGSDLRAAIAGGYDGDLADLRRCTNLENQ
jgi:Flp pilus assembly protein TadG